MQIKGKVTSITVAADKKHISLRYRPDKTITPEQLGDIRESKHKKKELLLGFPEENNRRATLTAVIKSINIRDEINILIHADFNTKLAMDLITTLGMVSVLRFETEAEKEIIELLEKVAHSHATNPAKVLYDLTTFAARDGTIRAGKKSIHSVSDAQRKVVLDKLRKIVAVQVNRQESCAAPDRRI